MYNLISWMKSVIVIAFLFVSVIALTACNEVHPDNLPGAINNPYPELSIIAASSISIDAADASMVYSIPVSFSVAAPVNGQVHFRLIPGTAIQGRDYVASTGVATFNEGERQTNIEVTLLNDVTRSQARDFRIELMPSLNASLSSNINHSVTIAALDLIDEPDPQSALLLPTKLEFLAPATGEENYLVVLPLSKRLTAEASVQINSIAGTAREGMHYRPITGNHCVGGVCKIAADTAELVFTLPIIGQAIDGTYSFKLQFLAGTGIELGAEREIEVQLTYNTELVIPEVNVPSRLSLRMPSRERGRVTYPIIMTFSEMLQHSAQLEWRTVDGSAIAGVHYQAMNATDKNAVILKAGQVEFEVELELLHVRATKENMHFQIQLVSAEGLELPLQRTIDVEIIPSNEQSYPQVSFPDAFALHEPIESEKEHNLYLTLSEALPEAAEIGVHYIEGTAKQGVHFEVVKYTLQLDKGSNVIALPVRLKNNKETAEVSFQIELHSPLNINLPYKKVFDVRIVDQAKAAPEPQLTLSPQLVVVPVPRWNIAQDITLYFQLTGSVMGTSLVNVESRSGTAVAGVDFNNAIISYMDSGQLNVNASLLPQSIGNEAREFELVFTQANGVQLPESRVVTVQIEPRETPALPAVIPPREGTPVVLSSPITGVSEVRKMILPLSNVAPLVGTLTLFIENGSAQAGVDFSIVNHKPQFNIGAQEIIVEFQIKPGSAGKRFRVILESAENVVLPSAYEGRVIDVLIL